ncbi:nucleotidyl transferase AbiEii/AbiGii toxin family protein [uncultured Gilvimarinus sp.]|uniref:nucleotidyl transferase AbiEii/AbiGii toxin family protein n=1 Tax=uncultured Gilvimarinus sp. TaxID=1689143 RepID=UPI0030ED40E9|tara:strand:+ start:5240 stop:6148 length:909 start_codon:yes stop_codon:yes gene_type:complete
MTKQNKAASIRARLLTHARKSNQDFNLVLTRFCLERLLYRISVSDHAHQFLLKGALLFDLWFDIPHRPTRDIDLLGFGTSDIPSLKKIFKKICSIWVSDGVEFAPDTVRAEEIRKDASYSGIRITLMATLDGARSKVQADVGFGDAVTPGPQEEDYPTILKDLDAPRLKTYPRYTVVAEKFEALSKLGMTNSRMKDYFDLWILASNTDFEGKTLSQAINATFSRRNSSLPVGPPLGLTVDFSNDAQKQIQWQAFLRKNALDALPLKDVVSFLADFLMPAVNSEQKFAVHWKAGGPWQQDETD